MVQQPLIKHKSAGAAYKRIQNEIVDEPRHPKSPLAQSHHLHAFLDPGLFLRHHAIAQAKDRHDVR